MCIFCVSSVSFYEDDNLDFLQEDKNCERCCETVKLVFCHLRRKYFEILYLGISNILVLLHIGLVKPLDELLNEIEEV